jgi:hypothetical protein
MACLLSRTPAANSRPIRRILLAHPPNFRVAGACVRAHADDRRPPALPLWIHQHFGGGVRERTVPGGASLPYRHCPDLQASWHGRIKEAPVNKSHVRITHAPVLPASLDLSEPAARGCSTAGEKIALHLSGVMHVQPAGRLYIPVI